MKTIRDIEDFRALDPFFRIIEQGLEGLVDGGHFFDLLAEDVVFEFIEDCLRDEPQWHGLLEVKEVELDHERTSLN